MTIEEIWNSLEDEALKDGCSGIVKRRVLPESLFDLFLGYDNHENRRIFLLKINRSNIHSNDSYPESRYMEIRILQLPDDDTEHATFELILTNSQFTDVFTRLVEDIIEQIGNEKIDEKSMLKRFTGRLLKWQQFLEQYTLEGLSEAAQRGLYGELWFLRKYIIPICGIIEGINAWCGPEGSPQDFRLKGYAIEVKTTIGKQHETIMISNEQQLDDTGLKALFLQHISLVVTTCNNETLPEIIKDIRTRIENSPASVKKFSDLLIDSGYIDTHAERYQSKGYSIRSYSIFHIKESFPRIIVGDLRNGVGDVHYSINVSECKHYGVNEQDFKNLLGGVIKNER